MSAFPVHSIESAPQDSRAALETLRAAFGFIPNIAGAMASSSVLVRSLPGLFKNVHTGSFSEPQIQAILLTNAVTNACTYAVALHTFLALKEQVEPMDVEAIRRGRLPQDLQLAALSRLAKTLIEKRGRVAEQDEKQFLGAGFRRDHLLEVITVVAASTITNYTGNVTNPPLEPQFQPHAWSPPTPE
jgi:alkylhydroperoxidase family enzyme